MSLLQRFLRKSDRPTTSADESAQAEGYQSDEHKRASERGKRERAARTDADRVARAKSVGLVARAEYMEPELERESLASRTDGLPEVWFERVRDRLLVATRHGWVNPRSRTAYRAGIHSFALAGTGYHAAAVKAGRFTPGALLRLVREPDNPHDPNAIAVYAERARNKAGYVPKLHAKRLAQQLDKGIELVAVSVRGNRAGAEQSRPHVLVCTRPLYDRLIAGETRK